MQQFLTILFFVTLSYVSTAHRLRDAARPYCDAYGSVSGARFNFIPLAAKEHVIKDEKFGSTLKLALCSPLQKPCQGRNGYRICLTKDNTEIGIGLEPPDPMDLDNGKLEFVFFGDVCRGEERYSVHVIMKCNNEDGHDNEPKMIPQADEKDCVYHIVWESKAACGPENIVNCTAVGSDGQHYDLSPLMMRSENYKIPTGSDSESMIILNVCHSVVFDYDTRCPLSAGSCLRQSGKVKEYNYKNIGDVNEPPKFDKKTKELTLTYDKGAVCSSSATKKLHVETVITFICDYRATNTLPVYVGGDDVCQHRLIWRTSAACSIESLKNESIASAGNCKVTDPLTNDEFDLRELMNRDYRSKANNGLEYSFQVCGSVSDGSCSNDAGGCMVKNKTSTGLANSNLMWKQGGPYLNYTNGADCGKGQRRYTLIGFFCGAERSISSPTIMENDDCALIIHWNTPLVCKKKISCQTQDGKMTLVSMIKRTDNYVVKANDTEFHINICRPLVPKPYLTCSHGSSACHVKPETNGKFSDEVSLGYVDKDPFFDEKKNIILRYTGGSSCPEDKKTNISSVFTFLCNYTAGAGSPIHKSYENCTHAFEWTSSIVCPTGIGKWENDCTIFNPHLSHKMNLTSLKEKVHTVLSGSGDEYKINLCGGPNNCKDSAVCKNGEGFGAASTVIFDYNRNVIKLKFSNGTQCKTGRHSSEIHLSCAESSGIGEPKLVWEYSCSVVFEWKTNIVCPNYTADQGSMNGKPRIAETIENIEEAAKGHVGTIVGVGLLIASCTALIIYLWSSHRRARLRYFCNSLTSRRDSCRAQYTKVDATEEARLLLDIGETTQCVTDSESDDELLDA